MINGKRYIVLSHPIKGTKKNGKAIWIPLMEIVNLVADAVAEYDNAADRPEPPNWITVDQLAHWLENSNKLSEVDVYSVIAKTLGFIAHYSTPLIHHGLYVVAADPETYQEFGEIGESYNEIFIASITEGWTPEDNNDDKIGERMLEARVKIDKLVHDIIQNHSKPNLEQRNVTWTHNKGILNTLLPFGSNPTVTSPTAAITTPIVLK